MGSAAAAAIDAAADPIQQAYEEGKANAAETLGESAAALEAEMAEEEAEAEATADAELTD